MSDGEDQYGFAQRRIDGVRHVTLIEVTVTEGAGFDSDPVHHVTRYYTTKGELVGTVPEGACE